jgi:hypothetical protein
MTEDEKANLVRAISTFVREEILRAFKPLRERLDALESTGLRYVGVYQKAQEYKRGDVCTHDGSMWVATCEIPPHQIPGNSSRWQLSVKAVERNRSPTRFSASR